jgi:hypothetical protein
MRLSTGICTVVMTLMTSAIKANLRHRAMRLGGIAHDGRPAGFPAPAQNLN